ncbi:MAG: hypothetical protein WC110_05160 [Bacteroidales bacterium]|jgi:hypothetical protein
MIIEKTTIDRIKKFRIDYVDDTYQALLEKGINFINEPTDMPDWGIKRTSLINLLVKKHWFAF